MAIPSVIDTSTHRSATASILLFKRLPDRLFAPLSSPNRHRFWALLCYLYEKRFGPDAPLPPSNGFSIKDIQQDIEDQILTQNTWESEDDYAPETPIKIRANIVFNRLLDSGWFIVERYGVEKKVTMKPAVSQFFGMLIAFAETGPVFVSGKIRSIDLNLQQIIQGKADGDTLSETSEQARNLLEHVRNTGTHVRDIMDALKADMTTAQYVQRFFNDYIERLFIGDYRELRTREHPLSKRSQILRTVEEICYNDSHRKRLIEWYRNKRCSGDSIRAEQLFEKDIRRLEDLKRIDEYLDRLDDEIRRANRRALAFLDYRLRSLQPIDQLVKDAIEAVISGKTPEMSDPFPPGRMISADRLAEPRKVIERAAPSFLRKHIPSELEIAKSRVLQRARETRMMTPLKLADFVKRKLDDKIEIKSSDLRLSSIGDVRAYQELSNIGLAMSSGSQRLYLHARMRARGFKVNLSLVQEPEGSLITGRSFTIERTNTGRKPITENSK